MADLVVARGPVIDRRARLVAVIVAVLTFGFVGLAVALRQSKGTVLDVAVTTAIQRIDVPMFDEGMRAVTALGFWPWDWLVLGSAAAGFWLAGFRRAVLFLLATPVPGLLTGTIKELIARPRPANDVVRVAWQLLDYSFPSGHVVSFVSLYGFLFFLTYVLFRRSAWRFALLLVFGGLAVLVGPSRIYLGHHWASDVLGGYALGTAFLLVLVEGYRLTTTRPAATPAADDKVPT